MKNMDAAQRRPMSVACAYQNTCENCVPRNGKGVVVMRNETACDHGVGIMQRTDGKRCV